MSWSLPVEIEDGDAPLYVRIADGIRRDIERGRLHTGQKLPGARRLAVALGVHRNTITAAFDELEQQGWLRTEPARGRYVAALRARPRLDSARIGVPRTAAFPLGPPPPSVRILPRARYDLAGGLPDPRLYPADAIGRAYRRAARKSQWLDYGPPEGNPHLRGALAEMLGSTRALSVTPDDLVVTRGSQHAIWLTVRALLEPGDHVAVESYGYRPAWEAMRAGGAVLHPISVDDAGLDVEQLGELCEREPIRLVYVTPHHQYPTTVALSAPRRAALLELARRHRFAILEDDYDHELHYEGRPILPMASRDTSGSVVYVGTLSKVLAPGLRIGWVVAPPPVITRISRWRRLMDRQGDLAVEAAVAELMEDGELQRHAFRMRKTYVARRDVLLDAIDRSLPNTLQFRVPRGGMSIWAHAPGIDVEAWRKRALERDVSLRTAADCAFDGRARPHLRLGFARCDEGEIRTAVQRLAKALKTRRAPR